MTTTVLEIKNRMLQLISEVNDQPTLELLLGLFFKVVKEKEVEPDWWDELSPELQAQLDAAMEEINDPKNLVSDVEARKMLARWL